MTRTPTPPPATRFAQCMHNLAVLQKQNRRAARKAALMREYRAEPAEPKKETLQ